MRYVVRWTKTSLGQLGKLEKSVASRILDKVESVSNDPFAHVQKLAGIGLYRIRVGEYRVIMSIESGKMIIFVLEIGHRRTIYRKF